MYIAIWKLDRLLENTGDMALKRRAKRIVEHLKPKAGDKILDVGCGDGYYLHLLSSLEPRLRLTGMDYDKRALASCKNNLEGKKIRLVWGDLMKKLPFENNSFDKIIMSEVLEHLPDEQKGLTEVYRVLRKGGLLCLTVPNAKYPFLWDPLNWVLERAFNTHIKSGFWAGIWNQHIRLYTTNKIQKVLRKASFKVEICESLTFWSLPFNHYLLNLAARGVYGGKFSEELSNSVSKFKPKDKKNSAIDMIFKIVNLVDMSNDYYTNKEIGVSVFVKAHK